MAVRYVVKETFSLTGVGPVVVGLLLQGEVVIGETLQVERTGAPVRIRFVDLHTRLTDEGLLVSVQPHPADAAAVTPGSVLVSRPQG